MTEYNVQSPLIKLKSDDSDGDNDIIYEKAQGALSSAKPKQPFNRQEYMRNYMREYMRNKNKQQKQKKINDEIIMRNAVEVLVDVINAYIDYFTDAQKELIEDVCDTKKNEISHILQKLTNVIRSSGLF